MSRLTRNISSLVGSEIARRVLGFFAVAYMARVLAVEGFGQVMIGLTVLSYVALAGSAGLHVLGTRSVASSDASVRPGEVLAARLANTVVAYLLVAAVTLLFVGNEALRDVILISAASAFFHALFLEWYFQGKETMLPNAVARSLGAFVYLAVLVLLVHSVEDVRLAALAAVAGDLCTTAVMLGSFRRLGERLGLGFSVATWAGLMKRAIPFGAGSVLGHVSVNLPILLVGALLGSSDAGIFSAASKLVFFLLMMDRILGTVLLPASVRFHTSSPELLHANLSLALRWIVIVALPVCAGGLVLGPELITLVYGADFLAAGPVFSVLVWFVLLTLLHTVFTSGVIAAGRDDEYRNVMVISAGLYAVLILGGILAGGLYGAAAGMVTAEGITVVLMHRAMRRTIDPIRPERLGRLVTSTAVMVGAVLLVPDEHVLVRVALGAIVFVIVSFTLKAVSVRDYRLLLERIA